MKLLICCLLMAKVFTSNSLSLNVPDPAFESWLRDSGYLEILDTTAPSAATATPETAAATTITITHSFLHYLSTFVSLLTVNPFAKLTTVTILHAAFRKKLSPSK